VRDQSKKYQGITVRRTADGTTAYQAHVWSARDNRRIRKTFPPLPLRRAGAGMQ
jgi:hypothetical protein